jgi:hypothetical protein
VHIPVLYDRRRHLIPALLQQLEEEGYKVVPSVRGSEILGVEEPSHVTNCPDHGDREASLV